MQITRKLKILAPALFGLFFGVAAPASALDLANEPLFTLADVPPNVLVAVSNSGSMDFETLVPTRKGVLYWKAADAGEFWLTGVLNDALELSLLGGTSLTQILGGAKSDEGSFWDTTGAGHFNRFSGDAYVYLFPNGYNNGVHGTPTAGDGDEANGDNDFYDRRVYAPDSGAQQNSETVVNQLVSLLGLNDAAELPLLQQQPILGLDDALNDLGLGFLGGPVLGKLGVFDWQAQLFDYNAIPPLPAFAFARSPDYNRAYFDPSVEYGHWVGYSDATATNAWADPAEKGEADAYAFNLTQVMFEGDEVGQQGFRFDMRPGMNPSASEHGYFLRNLCLISTDLTQLEDLLGGILANPLDIVSIVENLTNLADPNDVLGALDLQVEACSVEGNHISGAWVPQGEGQGRLFNILVNLPAVGDILDGVLDSLDDSILGGLISGIGGILDGIGDALECIFTGNCEPTREEEENALLDALTEPLDAVLIQVTGLLNGLLSPLELLDLSSIGGLGLLGTGGTLDELLGLVLGEYSKVAIAYYPATFYLEPPDDWDSKPNADFKQACLTLLPAGYGVYTDTGEHAQSGVHSDHGVLIGYAPGPQPLADQTPDQRQKRRMCGFEIKPGTDAMQNFANWFSYYRKRHLAVRGGLVHALNEVGGLRVAVMPTSNAMPGNKKPLAMNKLEYGGTSRSDLYQTIYNIDFSEPRGAPDRQALAFLGDQLETNDSIITQACQGNFAMLFTDGYNTGQLSSGPGNADQNNGSAFADNYSDTTADVAMHYYEDLDAPDGIADNQVPISPSCRPEDEDDPWLDCNSNPHMVTYGVTLGQSGLFYGTDAQDDVYNNPPWNDFDPSKLGKPQIDDLWHATINSRGDMLTATTPAELVVKFKAALAQMVTAGGSGTSLAVDSAYLRSDTVNYAYQASFVSGTWSGDLVAKKIGTDGRLAEAPAWSAADLLNDRNLATNPRVILTTAFQDCGNDKTKPVAFQFGELKKCVNPLTEKGVAYIRGDQSNEMGSGESLFRERRNILGDIVHSNPVYVGAPNRARYPADWDDALQDGEQTTSEDSLGNDSYATFVTQNSGRTTMLYVGANDGMLHGFNATTGAEVLAYIPGVLLDSLVELAQTTYGHRPYVDGTPVIGDVVFDSAWHTVLVGGLRGGGRSIYALDITNPDGFSEQQPANTVLWEFAHDELGYTYGKPAIVRLHNRVWAAVFGNGYNSASGKAQLFIVNIKTGELIEKIDTGAESDNGLGPVFPVDLDGDFITDYVYAGDLKGNLWKFDLTSDSNTDWSASKLFQGERPITSQPQVGAHPYGLDHGVMVYFGTGQYIAKGDPNLKQTNAFYGIWDPNVFTSNVNGLPTKTSVSELIQQDVLNDNPTGTPPTYRAVSQEPIGEPAKADYRPGYESDGTTIKAGSYTRGWYLTLPATGERVISNARLQGSTVAFSTLIPGSSEVCGASGSGFFMILNQFNGGGGQPAFDINGDGDYSIDDDTIAVDAKKLPPSGLRISSGIPGAATYQVNRETGKSFYIVPTSDGSAVTVDVLQPDDQGRVSWREIRR